MVKTADLHLVPHKSYSKNGESPFILNRTIAGGLGPDHIKRRDTVLLVPMYKDIF